MNNKKSNCIQKMPNKKLHIIKDKYIKYTVVLLSVFYVLGPLHEQISNALHAITHAIEMPDNIISHNSNTLDIQTHKSPTHSAKKTTHNHKVLGLISSLLNFNKNSAPPQNRIVKSNTIDKHIKIRITSEEVSNLKRYHYTKNNFTDKKTKLCKGFFMLFKEPPQVGFNTI